MQVDWQWEAQCTGHFEALPFLKSKIHRELLDAQKQKCPTVAQGMILAFCFPIDWLQGPLCI